MKRPRSPRFLLCGAATWWALSLNSPAADDAPPIDGAAVLAELPALAQRHEESRKKQTSAAIALIKQTSSSHSRAAGFY